jgi:hypothetical protein
MMLQEKGFNETLIPLLSLVSNGEEVGDNHEK